MPYEALGKVVEEYSLKGLPFGMFHVERRRYNTLGNATLKSRAQDFDFLRGLITEITTQIGLAVCLTYRELPWYTFEALSSPISAKSSPIHDFQSVLNEQIQNRQCVSYYVGKYKREKGLPIEDRERELTVKKGFKEAALKLNCPTMLAEHISEFAEHLIKISKDVQTNLDIIPREPTEISLGVLQDNVAEPNRRLDILHLQLLSDDITEDKYNRMAKHLVKVQQKRYRRYIGTLMKGLEPNILYFIKDSLHLVVDS